jgi:hypothetical protein
MSTDLEWRLAGAAGGVGAAVGAAGQYGLGFKRRLSGGYTISKGWSLYLYSYYRGSQVLLQGLSDRVSIL